MIEKKLLSDLYINQKLTTTEIAKRYNKTGATISNWLRKYNIPIRQGREAQQPKTFTKKELYDLYVIQELSINSIAINYNSSEVGVTKMLNEFKIPIRDKNMED